MIPTQLHITAAYGLAAGSGQGRSLPARHAENDRTEHHRDVRINRRANGQMRGKQTAPGRQCSVQIRPVSLTAFRTRNLPRTHRSRRRATMIKPPVQKQDVVAPERETGRQAEAGLTRTPLNRVTGVLWSAVAAYRIAKRTGSTMCFPTSVPLPIASDSAPSREG